MYRFSAKDRLCSARSDSTRDPGLANARPRQRDDFELQPAERKFILVFERAAGFQALNRREKIPQIVVDEIGSAPSETLLGILEVPQFSFRNVNRNAAPAD